MSTVPAIASYRLQFTSTFRFRDARRILPYLKDLGISHVYASPITRARRGSTHGYDVCDPRAVNPELGSHDELLELLQAVRAAGMGWIQDVVPNHLAASTENPLWHDLLTHGSRSRWAELFAIDWDHPDLDGRVQLPILAEPYAACLRAGAFMLVPEASGPLLAYGEIRLPLDPRTLEPVFSGQPACRDLATAVAFAASETDPDRRDQQLAAAWSIARTPTVRTAYCVACAGTTGELLDRLLLRQPWRLAWWRSARDMIGYRRFFAVDDLVAVRSETDAAFDVMHALTFELADRGLLDAVRIDHLDGLRDPDGYLERLHMRLPGTRIIIEKILARNEAPPRRWPIAGTSGYEFLAQVLPACRDPEADGRIAALHRQLIPDAEDPSALATRLREDLDRTGLAGDVDRVVRAVRATRSVAPAIRDLPPPALRRALCAMTGRFPVYRTYGQSADRPLLDAACARACAERPALASVIGAVQEVLGWGLDPAAPVVVREALLRFQQLTGPAMAKGCEDTFFYADSRWIAFNEVGGDPLRPGPSPAEFVAFAAERGGHQPLTLNATSTHDTKRGEDARARLIALTWHLAAWERFASRWLSTHGAAPHRGDQYFLLQTLVATWPADPRLEDYPARIRACTIKSLREAGQRSSWSDPDTAYEALVTGWLDGLLADGPGGFHAAMAALVGGLTADADAVTLCQTVLKCTLPGVPDIYQGSEQADFSFVDPDNRRPVDYARLAADLLPLTATVPPPGDPRRKQTVMRRCLVVRRADPGLWSLGATTALAVDGDDQGLFAFSRTWDGRAALLVASARASAVDARMRIPDGTWTDALTDRVHPGGIVRVDDLLEQLPCALLLRAPSA